MNPHTELTFTGKVAEVLVKKGSGEYKDEDTGIDARRCCFGKHVDPQVESDY